MLFSYSGPLLYLFGWFLLWSLGQNVRFFGFGRAGFDSSGSALGSEFAEKRLDVTPPNALPEYQSIRDRGGPILRLPNQVWMVGERRMDRMLVGHFS